MTATAPADTEIRTAEVMVAAGVGYRVVHYWCHAGIFGSGHAKALGTGQRRRFTAVDLQVAVAVGRLSRALNPTRRGGTVSVELYRLVADQIRMGIVMAAVDLGEGVCITVDLTASEATTPGDPTSGDRSRPPPRPFRKG